jgi:RNA polymerase sigma-70 factor, ECF subfamily
MARVSPQRADVAGPSSRDSLVSRCLSGGPAAWRDLHREYYPVAAAFLRKLGVKEAEMEDACQEVFLQMFRYLPSFRGEANLKTWLYRLCATEAGKWRRRWRVLSMLSVVLHGQAATFGTAGQEFDSGLARKRVEAALALMKPAERMVFVLFEMEGVSGEEIARIVKCPVATVWRRLHYARRTFRESLEAGASA